jgi:DNA-binding PadR family transcriptional regulator
VDVLTTRGTVLQLLRSGPGYGLDLIRRLKRSAGLSLTEARIYPVLKQLEREGLVSAVRVAPGRRRGGRTRIYYRLTRSGSTLAERDRRRLLRLLSPVPARPWSRREREAMIERLCEADELANAADELEAATAR